MTSSAPQPFGEWEWSTSEESLLIPQPRPGERAVRVRYRPRGGRVYRSFLLLVNDELPLTTQLVTGAIEKHAAG